MASYRNKRMRKRIEDRIHSARNRALLIDKLIDGLSYKEVSEKYNLSVREVMEEAPDEQTRQSIERMIQKMDRE